MVKQSILPFFVLLIIILLVLTDDTYLKVHCKVQIIIYSWSKRRKEGYKRFVVVRNNNNNNKEEEKNARSQKRNHNKIHIYEVEMRSGLVKHIVFLQIVKILQTRPLLVLCKAIPHKTDARHSTRKSNVVILSIGVEIIKNIPS